jgi:hypothetical protein
LDTGVRASRNATRNVLAILKYYRDTNYVKRIRRSILSGAFFVKEKPKSAPTSFLITIKMG